MSSANPTQLDIQHETGKDRGRFFIVLGDGVQAQMTYVKAGDNIVSINHTGVPPEFRGQNIAAQLVEFGVKALAETGTKIVPTCSYVAAQFKRHKDWQEFLA